MEPKEAAKNLVFLIHRSIDWNIWGSKRLKYWEILQGAVAAAAYTSNLSKWLEDICGKMSITAPGINAKDREILKQIFESDREKQILKCLREETRLLVLMVRVEQQDKRQKQELISKRTDEILQENPGLIYRKALQQARHELEDLSAKTEATTNANTRS